MQKYLLGAGMAALELLAKRSEGITALDMAHLRGVNVNATRKTLARLVEKKLVVAEPADDCGNARNKLIFKLTSAGRNVVDGVHDVADVLSDEDDEDEPPVKRDTNAIVAHAVRFVPSFVFDAEKMTLQQPA